MVSFCCSLLTKSNSYWTHISKGQAGNSIPCVLLPLATDFPKFIRVSLSVWNLNTEGAYAQTHLWIRAQSSSAGSHQGDILCVKSFSFINWSFTEHPPCTVHDTCLTGEPPSLIICQADGEKWRNKSKHCFCEGKHCFACFPSMHIKWPSAIGKHNSGWREKQRSYSWRQPSQLICSSDLGASLERC